MSKEKTTQGAVDNLLHRLSVLKDRKGKIESFVRLKDNPDWLSLKGLLEDMATMHARTVEATVEHGEHMEDHDRIKSIDGHKKERDMLRWVVGIVEKPKAEIERLEHNITDLEQEIAEKRQELSAFGLAEGE